MTNPDLSPEGLDKASIAAEFMDCGVPDKIVCGKKIVPDDWFAFGAAVSRATLRALATERRNDFLAGALAMREAAKKIVADHLGLIALSSPGSKIIADAIIPAINVIDCVALSEEECRICEGHGCVATNQNDMDGFPIEVECPRCMSRDESIQLAQWIEEWASDMRRYNGSLSDPFKLEQIAALLRQPVASVLDWGDTLCTGCLSLNHDPTTSCCPEPSHVSLRELADCHAVAVASRNLRKEIEYLRAVIRTNGLRHGATEEQISEVLTDATKFGNSVLKG